MLFILFLKEISYDFGLTIPRTCYTSSLMIKLTFAVVTNLAKLVYII